MIQRFEFRLIVKCSICILFFMGSILLNQMELLGQKSYKRAKVLVASKPSCQNNNVIVSPTDVLNEISCKHLEVIENDKNTKTRINSLNIISAAATLQELDNRNDVLLVLQRLVDDPSVVLSLKIQIIKSLPSILTHYDNVRPSVYETMVSSLTNPPKRPSFSYDRDWAVTKALGSTLDSLSIEHKSPETATGTESTHKRLAYRKLTQELKEIALNGSVDLQIRYNAVNALVKKGDEFLDLTKDPDEFKAKADQTSFYIIIQRLNEIVTENDLPPLLMRQSSRALNRFLTAKVP